jgi:hypothetical protein
MKEVESFHAWLQKQTPRADAIGAFARTFVHDTVPQHLPNYLGAWLRHLRAQSVASSVIAALGQAWREYRRSPDSPR